MCLLSKVSIHAPTREATFAAILLHIGNKGFNPRPYARGDTQMEHCLFVTNKFQSTPLRERRQIT